MGTTAGLDATHAIVIPTATATAGTLRTGDTPCWEASLRAHHHKLLRAGVTTWADEGKKLTAKPRAKKTPAATPA